MNLNTDYLNLLKRDGTHENNDERKALFYIIANNKDLLSKVDFIYDFKDRSIKRECLEENTVDLCSSSRQLVKLAFNLYNGYSADVSDVFSILDQNNRLIAHQAILIRFPVKQKEGV